jgi:hypothetical protein
MDRFSTQEHLIRQSKQEVTKLWWFFQEVYGRLLFFLSKTKYKHVKAILESFLS